MNKIRFEARQTPERSLGGRKRQGSGAAPVSLLFSLGACALLFWFTSYAYLYVYTFTSIKPVHGFILFLAIAVSGAFLHTRDNHRISIPHLGELRRFYAWFLIYLSWLVVNYSYAPAAVSTTQVFITTTEMAVIGLSALFLFSICRPVSYLVITCAVTVLFGTLLNFFDFVAPQFSKVPGRAAGWYENPNISGKTLSMLMVLSMLVIPRRLRMVWALLVGGGVFVTFSRGSWLLWAMGFAALQYYGWIDMGRKRSTRILVAAGLSTFILFALFSGALLEMLMSSRFGDLLTDNTITRLSGEFTDFAAGTRFYLVSLALESWSQAPLFGHGLGFTTTWGEFHRPHNMFLLFLVEGGLIGLSAYCALPAIMWFTRRPLLRITSLQFVVSSMFTHNNLEQIATILIVSLAPVLAYRFPHQPDLLSRSMQAG